MVKINLRETNSLSFDMKIDGALKSIESVSLNIDTGQGYQIKVPAKYVNETVECTIPVLDHILKEGEYQFVLDVVIDGKIFTPLTESFEVEAPLSITAQISESIKQTEVEEAAPVISVKKESLTATILKQK
jgi:hypothetical protein